jgi:predicted transcriptional regulator
MPEPENEHIGKAIDVDGIDLEKMREKVTANPGLLPYAHRVGSVVIKPEDEGSIKANALEAMRQQTDMQMKQLYEQMQTLAKQAKEIQERIQISERIYQAEIRFNPLIGRVYYLYEREGQKDTLSLIAPHEWGRSKKYTKFIAKVHLLADHTWEVLELGENL